MALKGLISQAMRLPTGLRFDRATWQPQQHQWRKLKQILKNNAQTEFGKQHGFADIQSIADYQKAVPIREYADFAPWLERMCAGEQNLLTYQQAIYYCRTSGTSGEPKITPITPDYREEYQEVVHAFLYYLYQEHPAAFNGQAIYYHGAADYLQVEDGTFAGSMSGFNSKNLPPLLQRFYAAPYEVMVIADMPSRHFCVALLSLVKNITLMIAVTPTPLTALAHCLQQQGPELIEALRSGNLPAWLRLNDSEKQLMQRLHQANPHRAAQLQALLDTQGALNTSQAWPELELLVCWKSSTAGSQLPLLQAAYPEVTIRDAIYSASEGWCNVPYTDQTLGGPLAIRAHFYEFIEWQTEASDSTNEQATVKLAHELDVGKNYRILLTTSGGLYRYDLGDILHVSHYYHQTPVVYFVQKVNQFSSLISEMISEEQVLRAMQQALQSLDRPVSFYALVPDPTVQPPRYQLYLDLEIESESESSKIASQLAKALDQALSAVNFLYAGFRANGDLEAIQAILLAKGSNSQWLANKIAAGSDPAQIKPPALLLDKTSLAGLRQLYN